MYLYTQLVDVVGKAVVSRQEGGAAWGLPQLVQGLFARVDLLHSHPGCPVGRAGGCGGGGFEQRGTLDHTWPPQQVLILGPAPASQAALNRLFERRTACHAAHAMPC